MKTILFKELKSYNIEYLSKKLEIDNEYMDELIKNLIERKLISKNKDKTISFKYVGIIIYNEKVLFIFPKYIDKNDDELDLPEFKQILKLLKEYSKIERLDSEEIETLGLDLEDQFTNTVSLVVYILDNYIENNIYYNEIVTDEYNGEGEILWDKTVDNIDPFIINGQVIYLDFITKLNILNDSSLITNVHKFIVNECIEFMSNTGLDLYLGYNLDKIDCDLDNIKDSEFIINKLEREMQIQFNDNKINMIKSMISFINNSLSKTEGDNIQLFGTRKFYIVWEKLCSRVFKNEFESTGNKSKYDKFYINPPTWENSKKQDISIDESDEISTKKNRLTPDILKTCEHNDKKYLLILDAKYYNIVFRNNTVEYNPGIADISKQYLYKLALDKYIKENTINKIENIFLFPTSDKDNLMGYVSLDFIKSYSKSEKNIKSDNDDNEEKIKLVKLNVENLIELYCKKEYININQIFEILCT